MKIISFCQVIGDRIRFITDESSDPSSLSYKKFCENIFKYYIKDPGALQLEIDTFHTVQLNIETGEWFRVFDDNQEIPSFDVLAKLNPSEEEKIQQERNKKSREVNLTKQYFDKKWEDKKRDLFRGYGKQ
jgi:hypothetical protein